MREIFRKALKRLKQTRGMEGGFTSHGAKPTNSYNPPPPPPPPPPPTPPSGGGGSGGGGQGPDFYCTRDELQKRGYTETTVNAVTQSGYLSAWATNSLNEQANQTIQTYQSNDHAFKGAGNPEADNFVRFYPDQGNPEGRWHGSIQELESKAQLRFNASSHNSVEVAVQKFYDLPTPPSYSSQASFTPQIAQVEISRTVSGKEQIKVNDFSSGVKYSGERAAGDLFSWLKFKP